MPDNRCLGKKAKREDPRTMRLSAYGLASLPAPPPAYDPRAKVTSLGVMLNDQLGDCAIAAPGHLIQIWTAELGNQVIVPDSVIESVYRAVGGYVPGDPSTDGGCVMIDVLNYWRQTGIAEHTIKVYGELSKTQGQLQRGVYYFGGVYMGFALPAAIQGASEWAVVPDGSADKVPGSWGGHAVCAGAYDDTGFWVVSWGDWVHVTWEFLAAYCDEMYVTLTPDQFNPQGTNPLGLNLGAMNQEFAAITA